MPHLSIDFDDGNKPLVKALEKRTALLERMLTKLNKQKVPPTIVKVVTPKQDTKSFAKVTSSLLGAISKMKAPNINISNKGSGITEAMKARVNLLEKLLRDAKKTDNRSDKVVSAINFNQSRQIREMQKNTDTLLSAFGTRNFTRGISVIPSPS